MPVAQNRLGNFMLFLTGWKSQQILNSIFPNNELHKKKIVSNCSQMQKKQSRKL